MKYPCDQYEHAATDLSNLRKHKQRKHRGMRYPCDQYEQYAATDLSNLRKHKQRKHRGI